MFHLINKLSQTAVRKHDEDDILQKLTFLDSALRTVVQLWQPHAWPFCFIVQDCPLLVYPQITIQHFMLYHHTAHCIIQWQVRYSFINFRTRINVQNGTLNTLYEGTTLHEYSACPQFNFWALTNKTYLFCSILFSSMHLFWKCILFYISLRNVYTRRKN